MKKELHFFILISILFLSTFRLNAQNLPTGNLISIGFSDSIQSNVLHETRRINIYLPLEYNKDTTKKFPVIFLLDGGLNEDFIHISGLFQFSALQFIGRPGPCIIVGIENVDRIRDFTFCPDSNYILPEFAKPFKKRFETAGESSLFIQFMENEVIPWANEHLRGNGERMLIGQSMAGLMATEILLFHPQLFDDFIIVSPSVWWNDWSFTREKTALDNYIPEKKMRVFIAVANEGYSMKKGIRKLNRHVQKMLKGKADTHFLYLPHENHATALHPAVEQALILLFSKKI